MDLPACALTMSLLEPEGLWDRVRRRCERDDALLPLLLIPLAGALGVALAAEAGVRLFNTEWNPVLGYSARPDNDGSRVGLLWLALALAPFVQAVVGTLVLPLYQRPRRWRTALAVFVVGAVPLYVAGLSLLLLPGILLVLVAFFVSIAWWTAGAHELLEVPRGEGAEFVTVSLLGASSALFLCSTAFPF